MAEPEFGSGHTYKSTETGIIVPVQLVQSQKSVRTEARLDTGAAFCLFDRLQAELLGLTVESGLPQKFRTMTGSFLGFGHSLTIRTYELEWDLTVYFYENETMHGNFLGRIGWLDRVRLGLIHHDQRIHISAYDDPAS